tara:strand:+ start:1896 stop:2660 length:765 start_codon:yes stop_codon:yes gene_type:complete
MIKLHVCFTGLFPDENFSNMNLVIDKLEKSQDIDVQFHIIFDPNQMGIDRHGRKLTIVGDKIKQLVDDKGINEFRYDSLFLKSNKSSIGVDSVMIQQESISSFLYSDICSDDDYVLRTRGDVRIRDEDLSRFLDSGWYDKLKNKMFLPFIGDKYVYDFCDYYWLSSVRRNKDCIFSDRDEIHRAWSNHNLTRDHRQFGEKILFIKPFMDMVNNGLHTLSEDYWKFIDSNFCIPVVGDHSKRPILDMNKKRRRKW